MLKLTRYPLITALICFIHFVSYSQNSIVTENALPGNPASQWDISGIGDPDLQGFATDISVNKGSDIGFKIRGNTVSSCNIKIYRLGYYQGNGAREIADLGTVSISAQPECISNTSTGLIDCGNWSQTSSWSVPSTAVSGIYIAKISRIGDPQNRASHIVFIVRDDAATVDLLFKTSDATWQAYNTYGGNDFYQGTVPGYPGGRAVKISYNRPFYTRAGGEDWLFRSEYPMIRWLERNGYSLKYTTDLDMERTPLDLSKFSVFLSVGHDEYWSANERNSVENARDNGKHLAFFSGNEVYWKTRWENSVDGSNTPQRTLVCYKEGTLGENACNGKCDPTSTWTGLWRNGNPAQYPGSDGYKPENSLTGTISWRDSTGSIKVPSTFKTNRFWRNSPISTIADGSTAILPLGTLGYEWSWENPAYQQYYPNKRILLSSTSFNGKYHKLSLYRHSSGALVFGAGTVQWSWGLSSTHDGGNMAASLSMQQATVNLLADMNAQPATLQVDLTPATASSDVTAPALTVTGPAENATVTNHLSVTVSGTASDIDGIVAGVEYSLDGGTTWQVAEGTTNWNFTFIPSSAGTLSVRIRGFDDSGNSPAPGAETILNLNVTDGAITGPYSLFPATNPGGSTSRDQINGAILGMKFRSSVNGYITGVRFYKASNDVGSHQGLLFTAGGTLLAQAAFTAETASGWQEVTFSTPVAITANTSYVVAYLSSKGYYSYVEGYFLTSHYNGPITAMADGTDGKNGLIFYENVPVLPTNSYNSSSYLVDLVFNATVPADVTPPTVVSNTPVTNAVEAPLGSNIIITFNEELLPASVNSLSAEFKNGGVSVPAVVSYRAGQRKLVITPSAALSNSTTYTVIIHGGTATDVIKDQAGNALAADYSFSFTSKSPAPAIPLDGQGGPILVINDPSNPFSIYPVEILRAEGWNSFKSLPLSGVDATVLSNYDVVILGNIPVSAADASMLTGFVNNGGTLITMRPDADLYSLLGISAAGGSLSDKYLLFNAATTAGAGLVGETIQFHGTADQYALNAGTVSLATLYSSATQSTPYPAVTLRDVGANGGQAIAFAYDLAKSVVLTRQGNPAWAGQERDGVRVVRSNDLFFGSSATDPQADWIDLDKVAIPQADEQMRLLTKIILQGNYDKKPLPRFWFLPSGKKAAIVMTGDDHGFNRTSDIFNKFKTDGPNSAQDVADWKAVRGTSYIYPATPITDAEIAQFQNDGFEIGLHLNTACDNWTPASWKQNWKDQWNQMKDFYPSINNAQTLRTHCIAWSDWVNQAKQEAELGVRLDVNYYYYPGSWVQGRSGMFTGSGMPMRFADIDGTMVDVYQVATQLTDESGQAYPKTIDDLLNKAVGKEGYYGVFCANMHTDIFPALASDLIVSGALARNIPVVSAKQMLDWVDGRNNSYFSNYSWAGNVLNFTVTADARALNLKSMLPTAVNNLRLVSVKRNSVLLTTTTELIKGVEYAFFDAPSGAYEAVYSLDVTPPVITNVNVTTNASGTAVITWTTDENADSRVDFGTTQSSLNQNSSDINITTTHSITLNNLVPGYTYYFRVSSADPAANSSTMPAPPADPLSFVMPLSVCASSDNENDFNQGSTDANTSITLDGNGAVILYPAVNQDFTAPSTPAGWLQASYFGTYAPQYLGGIAIFNGCHIYSSTSYTPGNSIEFNAKFTEGLFQNIGYSLDGDFNAPWVVIGRGAGAAPGTVYVRINDGTTIPLGTSLTGNYHRYKIKWNPTNFEFYVDGVLITTVTKTMTTAVIQLSDYNVDGLDLSVDWIRVSPYASSGTYTSKVFDAGSYTNWSQVNWTAIQPSGTSLDIQVRTGNTPVPDGTWSAFSSIINGGSVGNYTRYLQYRANIASTDNSNTVVLQDFSINCNFAFPVTLLNFKGRTFNKDVNLEWSTASESNNKGFDIQRSINGMDWNTIGFVPGVGTSSTLQQYHYEDKGLTAAKYYYRLKQIDFDGKFSYSNVISFNLTEKTGYMLDQNYPNPFSGRTTISYSVPKATKVRLTIYDLQGRIVKLIDEGVKPAGKHTTEIMLGNIGRGIYYYKMEADEFSSTRKMIVQ